MNLNLGKAAPDKIFTLTLEVPGPENQRLKISIASQKNPEINKIKKKYYIYKINTF